MQGQNLRTTLDKVK